MAQAPGSSARSAAAILKILLDALNRPAAAKS